MIGSPTLRIGLVAALFVAAGCVASNLATAPSSQDPPLHPAIGHALPVPPNADPNAAGGGVFTGGGWATPFPTGSASPTSAPCNGVWIYDSVNQQWNCIRPLGGPPGFGWGDWWNPFGPYSWWWCEQPSNGGPTVCNNQAKPGNKVVFTITGMTGEPLGITGDSAGNIFVTAFPHNSIDVYAAGSTTPTSSLVDIGLTAIYYIAMDHNGNLFADGWGPGGPGSGLQIDEFPVGSQTAHKLITITGKFPGGMAVNSLGTLYVADEGNGSNGVILTLKPPYNKVARTFSYNGLITGIDLDRLEKHIWAANLNAGGADVAQEYSLSGSLLFTTTALPAGIYSYGIAKKK